MPTGADPTGYNSLGSKRGSIASMSALTRPAPNVRRSKRI